MADAGSGGERPSTGPAIAVVGSANVDVSIPVPELPAPGQTVLGGDALRGGGGKGANQAVAAARLGARVAMVGRVGDDDGGTWLRALLDDEGIDHANLVATHGVPTGMAVIAVDPDGENSIVVSPGANAQVDPDDLDAAAPVLADAAVVLTQLEIPTATVAALRARCRGRLLLNPAPAATGLDLSHFDVVVPNRGELATLAGATVPGDEPLDASTVVDQARSLDTPLVVVTLGSDGAMVVGNDGTPNEAVAVAASPVSVVDTTAAGDSFCGALAVALGEGADVVAATRWAVRAAGFTVTRRGAQASLPGREAVGPWGDDQGSA